MQAVNTDSANGHEPAGTNTSPFGRDASAGASGQSVTREAGHDEQPGAQDVFRDREKPLDVAPEDPFADGGTGFEPGRGPSALRWLPWCVLALMAGFLAFSMTRCTPEEALVRVGDISPSGRRVARVSTETSELYRDNIEAYSRNKARTALEKGDSFVAPATGDAAKPPKPVDQVIVRPPVPVREASRPVQKPAPKQESNSSRAQPEPAAAREDLKPDPRVLAYLSGLPAETPPGRGTTLVLNAPRKRTSVQAAASTDTTTPQSGIRPGDILYAVNRVTLDSDQPGPAMAEIITGPWQGARVIGAFKRVEERLVLQFSELVGKNGDTWSIQAYAIDPRTDRSAVRSSVDTHFLSRWGGIVAASFLEGFGDAVRRSGTSSYSTVYGSGWTVPEYSAGEQAWIAAGKVGERLASRMDRNFDRAPTVVLESGTEIGVLMLRVDKKRASQKEEGQTRTPVVIVRTDETTEKKAP